MHVMPRGYCSTGGEGSRCKGRSGGRKTPRCRNCSRKTPLGTWNATPGQLSQLRNTLLRPSPANRRPKEGETEKQVKVPGRNCAFSALAGALTGFSDGIRSRRQPRWKGRREKKTAKNTARRDTTEQKNMRDGGAARRG